MNRRKFLSVTAGGLVLPAWIRAESPLGSGGIKPLDVEFIPRFAWTSAGVAHPAEADPMKPVTRITIHHDGMPPGRMSTSDQITSRIVAIRNSHSAKNYADIGYHFVVDPLGRVWEGRPLIYQGAHVKEHNEDNIGIMVLGNYQSDRPTSQALASLFKFTRHLMGRYRIKAGRIFTHREITATSCPGKNLQPKVDAARKSGGELRA